MGGNARVIDRKTGKVLAKADKIDLRKYGRFTTVNLVLDTLRTLDENFYEIHNERIWENFGIVKSGKAFSGSTEHFINLQITDAQFLKHKPIVGDIDVIVRKEIREKFETYMQSLENVKIIDNVKYLGQDRTDFGQTFLGVFNYKDLNFQIDFEYGDFEKKSPSQWAKFSHSSAWPDIVSGLKGVHHKFLIVNLVRAISIKNNAVIVTPSSTADSYTLVTGKKADQKPRMLAFSVDKGLRKKYEYLVDEKGKVVKHENKFVYKEIPSNKSTYTKNVTEIFMYIFGKAPSVADMKKFYSFRGVTVLMEKFLSKRAITDTFTFMVNENLYGKHAQVIEKDNPVLDFQVKQKTITEMMLKFPYLQKKTLEIQKMSIKYYENYK